MVPPTRYPVKVTEDPTLQTDKNSSMTKNITKLNIPSDPKYCDVPYTVNPMMNEHKSVRNTELPVSNVDVLLRSAPHAWPPSGVSVRPTRGYGPSELYHYPDYSSCAAPRTIPVNRPHRTAHEEALAMYPDSYYRGGNIRFEPYPSATKDRYQPRYEYMNNYSLPYNPGQYPAHKYEMPKLPTSALPSHPYAGYPQVPLKYLEKPREPLRDGYQRSTNSQQNYGVPFHSQGMHPNYGPVPGNCLQNKLYTYPTDATAHGDPHTKLPYETNKSFISSKQYQTQNNYYLNEIPGSHNMKPQMVMPNYPAMNMHPVPHYPYPYRKENMPFKGYDFPPQYKSSDPLFNTHMHRIPSQFSPNIISPVESNASNDHAFSVSPEDCGYVSQSSTTSIRSTDSAMNRYKVYDPRYGQMIRGSPLALRAETDSKSVSSKEKKNIDLRQFLQSWSEGDEEHGENNVSKETRHQNNSDPKQYEVLNSQEQLYVLGLVNVPSEELDKYEHIQKVSKLPDNIKGYTSIDLLNQFEEAIESSKIDNNYPRPPESKELKSAMKTNVPSNLPNRPLSPLDVEAKISQSVIHKDVGCNFEIRLCSPKMMNVEVAAPVQNVLEERAIEKVTNPLIVRSPSIMPDIEENCRIVKRQNRRRSLSKDEKLNIPSCKMIKTQYSVVSPTDNKKSNYSVQDLESNSGVCLASLPRLDNDIELSFPEVNQQFINANKVEPMTTLTNEINEPGSLQLPQSPERKDASSSPFSQSEESFAKLSKYRKLKMNKESIDDKEKTPAQPIRTDSVIIKNPENSENISMAEEKRNSCEVELEKVYKCNKNLDMSTAPAPMNLAMNEQSHNMVTYSKNLDDTPKVHSDSTANEKSTIVAMNLVQNSRTVSGEVESDKEPEVHSFVETKEVTENEHNVSLNKNDSGYSETYTKLDDEVFNLEQERRRQSLSLEAQLTPMSEDTSSDDSDIESDDATCIAGGKPRTDLPYECPTDNGTVETKTYLENLDSNNRVQFENQCKNEYKTPECSAAEKPTSSADNSLNMSTDFQGNANDCESQKVDESVCEDLSKSEKLGSLNETCQKFVTTSGDEPIPNEPASVNSPITENAETHKLRQSDATDSDSLSESESSSSESSSEMEQCSDTEIDDGCLDGNNIVYCASLEKEPPAPNHMDPVRDANSELSKISSYKNKNNHTECLSEIQDYVTPQLHPDLYPGADTGKEETPKYVGLQLNPDLCPEADKGKGEDVSLNIDSSVDNHPPLNDTEKENLLTENEESVGVEESASSADLKGSAINCEKIIICPIDRLEDRTVEKTYGSNVRVRSKTPVPFFKELFSATFQNLILEEGLYANKTESQVTKSDSTINDKAQLFVPHGLYEKTPTDLVEEHLERIHASDASDVNSDSDESNSTVKTDSDKIDDNNISNLLNNSEVDEKDMVAAETEDLLSSLSENSQHISIKKDREEIKNDTDPIFFKYDTIQHSCEPKNSSSTSTLSTNSKNKHVFRNKSEIECNIDNKSVIPCGNCVVREANGTNQIGCVINTMPVCTNTPSDSCKPGSEPQQCNDMVTKSENDVMEINNSSESKDLNCSPVHTKNLEESFDRCQTDLKTHNHHEKVTINESHVVKESSLSSEPEKNTTVTTSTHDKQESRDNCELESKLHSDNNNMTQLIGDVAPNILINYLNYSKGPQSTLKNENETVTQHEVDYTSCSKFPTHNTEKPCVTHSELEQHSNEYNMIKNKYTFDESSSSGGGPHDMGIKPNVTHNIRRNYQTETQIDRDVSFECDDVVESCGSSQVGNTISKPTFINDSKKEDSDDGQSTQKKIFQDNEVSKECVETKENSITQFLKNNSQDVFCDPGAKFKDVICDNNINPPIRRTTKRSLSESAIYCNSRDGGKDDAEKEEFNWIKRKKFTESNVLMSNNEDLDSELLTSENLSRFIQSRRNSMSSFYHEENVSFCILIDNDCIIAQDEFDQEAICFADIPEENFSTVVDNHILAVNEEPRMVTPLDQDAVDEISYEVISPLCPETMGEKTEESWVEDVACVETVVTEDIMEDNNNIYEDTEVASPNIDETTYDSENSDLNMYGTNDHADKIKNIYGNEMCSSQSINLIKTLYTTPQMNVNKTLHDTECQIVENTILSDFVATTRSTPSVYDESSCDSRTNETDAASSGKRNYSIKDDHEIQGNSSANEMLTSEIVKNTDYINVASKSPEIVNETLHGVASLCESSNDEVFYPKESDDIPEYKRFSSSPEVSSTTEEKKSGILLKITNFNGSRISHINNVDVDSNRRIRCKFTEENDYRSNLTSSRPLITKAAQKYIPPLKETTVNDLKVKLFLPEQSLLKLKQIKKSKEQPKIAVQNKINAKSNYKITKTETNKKHKPKFEDVLKSIDEIQIKMHREKSKKVDKSVPKVIIKKSNNGSHYASSTRETFNPDMTGRKWQPWVFLEKHKFIDKMATRGKTKAVFCHRKNTYILAENFKKYRSIGSTKFTISQPISDSNSSGPLKYTIKLKQLY